MKTPFLMILILCAGMALAQPVIKAVEVDPSPIIDGDLSDECWQKATSVADFYFTPDGTEAKEPTTAWICYDQKNIYAAFYCKDSQPDTIQSQQKKRGGGTYTDDCVILAIACYPNQGHTADFTTTAGGVQSEDFDWADVSKIEWRGDWQSAAKRVDDGYVVEMAVPFSILQYNADQTSFGLCFYRSHARLYEYWASPNIGSAGDYGAWYLWDGLRLPRPNTRPKLMAYSVVGTGRDDSPQRMGLDAKHALTPGLTGLLTLNPYFDDIEQQVASIDFTYNERYLPDSRPFFQEGVGYFPVENILYTRRIEDVDTGMKVYGEANNYSLAFMNTQKFGDEGHTCLQVGRKFGPGRSVYLCGVQSSVAGADYLSTMVSTAYRLIDRRDYKLSCGAYTIMADNPSSWGQLFGIGMYTYGRPKTPQFGLDYTTISPNYDPYLGYAPETDLRSLSGTVQIYDQLAKGPLTYWNAYLSGDLTNHINGSLFHKSIGLSTYVEWRKGTGISLYLDREYRPPDQNSLISLNVSWGQRSLYNNGSIGCGFGHQAGGDYLQYKIGESWGLADRLNLYAGYSCARLKPPSRYAYKSSQLISTLAYDFDNERTLAGRLVAEHGKTNFYLAYKQRVRSGMDAYIIFGDPNADSTRSFFALKLVRLL